MEEQNKKKSETLQVDCNHLWESLSEEDLSAVAGGRGWGTWVSCEENGSSGW